MSDLIIETKGALPGAILMQWNLAGSENGVAGMWDVHFRVGGTAGTELQSDLCSKNPNATTLVDDKYAAVAEDAVAQLHTINPRCLAHLPTASSLALPTFDSASVSSSGTSALQTRIASGYKIRKTSSRILQRVHDTVLMVARNMILPIP
ncbi:hypothetical protein F4679DRAFT_584966 [Xylaria curta]|nr:hypothetical protein F4679DRAFT_584966 [Xylaria curta]